MTISNQKSKISKVIVHWAESNRVPTENKEYANIQEVEDLIQQIALDESEVDLGYCKFKYTVIFDNSTEWTARLDITGDMVGKSNVICNEIHHTCMFNGGLKSNHFSDEEYEQFLSDYVGGEKERQRYVEFLEKHELELNVL